MSASRPSMQTTPAARRSSPTWRKEPRTNNDGQGHHASRAWTRHNIDGQHSDTSSGVSFDNTRNAPIAATGLGPSDVRSIFRDIDTHRWRINSHHKRTWKPIARQHQVDTRYTDPEQPEIKVFRIFICFYLNILWCDVAKLIETLKRIFCGQNKFFWSSAIHHWICILLLYFMA